MSIMATVKHIIYADKFVLTHRTEDEYRNQRGIAIIATASFVVMSILNIMQASYAMFATTSISAICLFIGYLVSRYKHHSAPLRVVFYIIFIVIFTDYTIMGGNDGFAALWLITATYAVMIAIDFKAGFLIGLYYLTMLLMVFNGPLKHLLQYDYNTTFMLRFPFLYAINFAFATYIIIRIRLYQYDLLIKQEELEHLSAVDLSTGLMNRNYFIQYESSFAYDDLQTLAAIFIDVNGLHQINNCDGHDAGDRMLRTVAEQCKKHFANDSLFRMGGDEFLIICKNAKQRDIVAAAKSLYDAVEREGYSISYGIELQDGDFNISELVKKADAKMIVFKKDYYLQSNQKKR